MTDTDETVTSSQAHSLRVWAGRIVAAVVVVYGVSVANDLLLADTRLIADRADMVSLDRVPAWSVEVQHALFGQGSIGYRLTAMLVHLLNCGLLLLVARRWTSASLAGWGTLIFAIWPSGSQAVLHLGSQAELLTTTWILSALWLSGGGRFHVIRAVGLLLIVILGLHTSAQAFALPLFLLLVHHRLARRGQPTPTWLMHLSAYGTAAGWLLWKMSTRAADAAIIDPLTNPLASLPTSQRVMVALDQGWSYAQSLLVPLRLSADYGFGVIDVSATLTTCVRVGLLLALLGFVLLRFVRHADLLSLGVLWWAVALLPASNVVSRIDLARSDAYLYLAMVGGSLSLAALLTTLSTSSRTRWIVATLLVMMGARTIAWCRDWRDDEHLWAATVVAQPSSARAHEALATALQRRGASVAAQAHYQRAIGLYPRFATAHLNLGLSLYEEGRWPAALDQFDIVCQLQPLNATAHLNRGAALFRQGLWMPAADAYRQAAELRPAWPVPWLNLGDALRAAGDEDAAAAAADHARSLGAVLSFD